MKRVTLICFLITSLSFSQEQEKKEAPWNVMYPEFMAQEAAEYFDEFNMLWSDESPIEAKQGRLVAKRLEEIYFSGESTPIYIDKKSESLKLIQKLRDEAHRFSLRQYRNRRDNQFIDSELINIDGIGEKTAVNLMKKFKSVKNIKSKSLNDLKIAIGDKKGTIIYNYYNK